MARPRSFDEDEVIDRATDVFWRAGYEGASIHDLTAAMGVTAPSIYSAFGSKRGLFEAVLDRYSSRQSEHGAWVLSAPTARGVAERMLYRAADGLPCHDQPPGCLLIQTGVVASAENRDILDGIARRGKAGEMVLRDRFEQAVVAGDLPETADPAALAGFVTTVFAGLSVKANAGATATELRAIVEQVMAGWPSQE